MTVLVGIYLVQGDAFDVVRDGKTCWTGTWTLFRSLGRDRTAWEPLTSGEALALSASRAMAVLAGQDEGVAFARELQADDGLEPVSWTWKTTVPTAIAEPLLRSCVGGRC